jgi:4-diphosphocytidyl-2-C-methyl-D-erythritol kinase
MKPLTVRAAAKINWMLSIVNKEADGMHALSMIMQKISLYDTLILKEAAADRLIAPLNLPQGANNLALKAWLLLKSKLGLKVSLEISLKKNIPAAAGLGGGSADAAAVLKGANKLFSLGISADKLREMGFRLGADIPFCLTKGPAAVSGRGEILTPLRGFPTYHLLIANPGIEISTRDAFNAYDKLKPLKRRNCADMIEALQNGRPEEIGLLLENHLEAAIIPRFPIIEEIKIACKKEGLFPLMSGSGASVFALASNEEHAREALTRLSGRWHFLRRVKTL